MPKGIYQRTEKHRAAQRAWHAAETPERREQRIAKQRATLAKKYEQLRLERARLRDLREKKNIERVRLRDEKNARKALRVGPIRRGPIPTPLPPVEVQKAVVADVKNKVRDRDVMEKYKITHSMLHKILKEAGIKRPRGNPQPGPRRIIPSESWVLA